MSVNYCRSVPVFHFWLAITITHPALQSLCGIWATCYYHCLIPTTKQVLITLCYSRFHVALYRTLACSPKYDTLLREYFELGKPCVNIRFWRIELFACIVVVRVVRCRRKYKTSRSGFSSLGEFLVVVWWVKSFALVYGFEFSIASGPILKAVRSRPDAARTPPGAVRMPPGSVEIRILVWPPRYHQQPQVLV